MKTFQSLFLLATLCAAGCTTIRTYNVKLEPQKPGVRYSLPKPVLIVSPSPNGGGAVDVEVKLMPDDSHTYAIDASGFLSSHKLQVDVQNRMLSKVVWNPDSTAVAAEGMSVAAEIAKAQIAAERERAAQEKAEREAQMKALLENLQKLNALVAQKETALDVAEKERTEAERTRADRSKAEAKVQQAKKDYDEALQEQQRLFSRYLNTMLEGDTPDGRELSPSKETEAWGPVMFALNEKWEGGKPTLTLEAGTYKDLPQQFIGEQQAKFPTVVVTPVKVEVTRVEAALVDQTLRVLFYLNVTPTKISGQKLLLLGPDKKPLEEIREITVGILPDKPQIELFTPKAKVGTYRFSAKIAFAQGEADIEQDFEFKKP